MPYRSAHHCRAAAIFVCLAPAVLLAPSTAQATTDTSTMAVTATVVATCALAASPLAFGNYTMSQTDSTTSVTATCTSGTTYTVALSAGTGSGASVANRKLTGPASATLNYSLYQDAGRTTLWGQTVGTDTVAGTGSGTAQTLTVYGRIPAAQGSAAGVYTDPITVTLTY